MNLSIIIVNYNTADLLLKCLNSILDNCHNLILNKDFEIIVVDNNSSDQSCSMLEQKYPEVKLLKNRLNFGFGKANNLAINKASGKYILLLNTDIVVTDNAISKLLDFVIKDKVKAFYGAKLINSDGTAQPSCGPFFDLWTVAKLLFFKGDKIGLTRFSPDKTIKTDWVSGACLLGEKVFFQELKGFDENIFMYMEEIDFLYRAQKKGYKAIFYPLAIFVHAGSGSSKENSDPVLNIYKGLIYFYAKHHSVFERIILAIMLKLKAVIAITVGIITMNQKITNTYLKALFISR